MPEGSVRFLIPPDLAEVARLRQRLGWLARSAGLPEERVFDVQVTVSEAVANAIEHAASEVQVDASILADRLLVEITNSGVFRPGARKGGAERQRGLGLPLMVSLADQVHVSREAEGKTRVSLTFFLRSGDSGRQPRATGAAEAAGAAGVARIAAAAGIPDAAGSRGSTESDVEDAMVAGRAVPGGSVLSEGGSGGADTSAEDEVRRLDALFAHALTPLVLLDREFNFVRVNEAYAAACGRRVEDFPGHNHFEFYPSDARVIFEEVLRTKRPFKTEARPFEFPDHPEWGVTYWDWTLTPLLDEQGEVDALVLALQDVTDQVGARPAVRQNIALWHLGPWLSTRKRAAVVVPVAIILQILLFFGLDFLSVREFLGIPGPAASLIGVVTAVLAGPAYGAIVAFVGGLAFMTFLGDFGESVEWVTIAGSIVFWVLVSLVAGVAADAVRRRAAAQEILLSQSVDDREALMDSLKISEEKQRQAAEENARLYRQQLDIAENLQSALISVPRDIGGVRLGHLYRSATEAARVGGDFYDVFALRDDNLAVLIGDVSGHGIEAARTATMVKDVVHAFGHQSSLPHEVLLRTNALLTEKRLSGFVTVFFGVLDNESGRMQYASAGHPEPMLRRASGAVQRLGLGSAPLGIFAEETWRQQTVELAPGDVLLIYTDGVTEARYEGEMFGEDRLEKALAAEGHSVEQLPEFVLDQVLAFCRGRLVDDLALLALQIAEPPAG